MITDDNRKEVTKSLQEIVDDFNERFTEWMKNTRCRSNIGWKYSKLNKAIKQLEVVDINLEVYSKPEEAYLKLQEGISMERDIK